MKKDRYSSSCGNPTSELWDVTCHMGSHSVRQVNAPRLTPAMQAGTRYSYPRGMEGCIDLVDLITPRPGVKLATFRSRVRRRTTAPPRQLEVVSPVAVSVCRLCLLCDDEKPPWLPTQVGMTRLSWPGWLG